MIHTIKKAVCAHEYEVRSVETTEFVVFEKCLDCGKTRRRDGTELTAEQSDTAYKAAS